MSIASMRVFSAAAVLAAAVVTTVSAGVEVPAVEFDLMVGGNQQIFNPNGTETMPGSGIFNYQGSLVDDTGWTFEYDLNAKPDPFISGNIVFTNNTLETLTVSFTVILPVNPTLAASVIGGSVAGGLTAGADKSTLSSTGGNAMWSALIDGNVVATLLDDPFSVSASPFESAAVGPESFGSPIPSMPGPAINDTMAINISFDLSAGAQASFTSVFVAEVPGPAGLALFGVAGMVARRRRRA